ncbi:erythromycin esterase family protein [Rufibacter sediminis]|uniref:Erythromycin esterase family protein n=1 Tax=Rufibacter sediminis TaxID=2762756 RepID=A0ABR6VR83_9BACT|nr:erythromycin esterase family protein [Rufibacter sediminis]MBC3539717.1 erythromycin esterase family protein [Rufibacter sediminis]
MKFFILTSLAISLVTLFSYKANSQVTSRSFQDTLSSSQMKIILSSIQNQSLVGIGEAEHGKKEYYDVKSQLVKSLIKEKGFTVMAFEGSMNSFERINEYVKGDSNIDVKKFLYEANVTNDSLLHHVFHTQEILDLINWIKTYNATHKKKVSIVGFDFQNPTLLVNDINKQLKTTGNKATVPDDSLTYFTGSLNKATLVYEEFYRNYMTYPEIIGIYKEDKLIAMAKNSSQRVEEVKNYVDRKFPDSKDSLVSKLKINLNALTALSKIFLDPNGAMERDKNMYENISYYKNLHKGEKTIVWAHNGHLSERDLVTGNGSRFYWMGYYLRQQFKSDFLTIGIHQNMKCASPPISSVKGSPLQVLVRKAIQVTAKCFEDNDNAVLINIVKPKVEKAQFLY